MVCINVRSVDRGERLQMRLSLLARSTLLQLRTGRQRFGHLLVPLNSRSSSLVSLRTLWLVRRANAERPTTRPESDEKDSPSEARAKRTRLHKIRLTFNAHARRWGYEK